jgi:hypothetical protein
VPFPTYTDRQGSIQLALGSAGPVSPLSRITRWLEKIGHKLRASNDCKHSITDFSKVMGDTVEVNKEIVILWLNIIMTFRNEGQGSGGITSSSYPPAQCIPFILVE